MATATPPEVQAQVMASLLVGQSVSAVAREFNLSKSTVSAIKARSQAQPMSPDTARDIGDQVADYLRELLATLCVQAKHMRSQEFLDKADAQQLAVVHGILADKGFRILEAAERVADFAPAGDGDSPGPAESAVLGPSDTDQG